MTNNNEHDFIDIHVVTRATPSGPEQTTAV